MKAGLLAAVLFALWAAPAFAVEKRHHYGHLPIHVRGTLQGWQTHEDVFYARAGQRILIKTHSAGMKWLGISVTPLSTNTPIFKSGETQGASQEVTLPRDGAYRLRVIIRPDGARLGRRIDFKIDVTAASRLAYGLGKPRSIVGTHTLVGSGRVSRTGTLRSSGSSLRKLEYPIAGYSKAEIIGPS